VNIAIHAARDVIEKRPAGMVLVSGDRDFMPVVELAARVGIPIAVFYPQEHSLHKLPPGVNYSGQVEITYLTREIMKDCRLSDAKWLEYLKLKVRERPKFKNCLDDELTRRSAPVVKSATRR
jgi:hypothetical protein